MWNLIDQRVITTLRCNDCLALRRGDFCLSLERRHIIICVNKLNWICRPPQPSFMEPAGTKEIFVECCTVSSSKLLIVWGLICRASAMCQFTAWIRYFICNKKRRIEARCRRILSPDTSVPRISTSRIFYDFCVLHRAVSNPLTIYRHRSSTIQTCQIWFQMAPTIASTRFDSLPRSLQHRDGLPAGDRPRRWSGIRMVCAPIFISVTYVSKVTGQASTTATLEVD